MHSADSGSSKLAIPLEPSAMRSPFFCPRHEQVLPSAKILRKHKQHLEGWGYDMIQRGGHGSLASRMAK